jgi:hypothetical protein
VRHGVRSEVSGFVEQAGYDMAVESNSKQLEGSKRLIMFGTAAVARI